MDLNDELNLRAGNWKASKGKARLVVQKKTPHQRIVQAAEQGKGLRLSAAEVARLARDEAISMAALHDDVSGAIQVWR